MRRPRRRPAARPARSQLLEPATQPMRRYPESYPYLSAPVSHAPPRRFAGQDATGWWEMELNDAPGPVLLDARGRKALQHLELDVADYAAQGMLYRIDDAREALQRGETLDERSVVAITVAKAVRHLMGPRQPWSAA